MTTKTITFTFKNIQHIDHKIDISDIDKYYQTKTYVKFSDDEWTLLSDLKIKKIKIDTYIEKQKKLTHQLKYHLALDLKHFKNPSLYNINFNNKQIDIEYIHHEKYEDIENWIPELKQIPFYVHHIQHGFCFAFITENDRSIMFDTFKKYFDESLYDIYKPDDFSNNSEKLPYNGVDSNVS